jgi:hypothetical protein
VICPHAPVVTLGSDEHARVVDDPVDVVMTVGASRRSRLAVPTPLRRCP